MASGKDFHLADVRTLLEVIRKGSITEAARTLVSTPSQVSKAVKRMERVLGGKLTGRATSTPEDLKRELEALIAQADRLSARNLANELVAVFSSELRDAATASLLAANTGVQWQIVTSDADPLPACDIALIFEGHHHPAIFDATPLGTSSGRKIVLLCHVERVSARLRRTLQQAFSELGSAQI